MPQAPGSLHSISQALNLLDDSIPMVALNLDPPILDSGTAITAVLF
ncbi:MAG: hypothetical protein GXX96_22645 [Planctomycetaceae bacterium]|nr:hypothetical protein [Planctomycetaceae bacterium]